MILPQRRPAQHNPPPDRFRGYIAGMGTGAGIRIVVGHWQSSPLGGFTDVMVQHPDGRRVLLAPNDDVAAYVRATYTFDEVLIAPVRADLSPRELTVAAGPLSLSARIGAWMPLGHLLRAVPRRLGTSPLWLGALDPLARLARLRTAGSAGGGRREFYGVTDLRRLTGLCASWDGEDLGGLRPVLPPVTFGFGSAPPAPSIATVVTTIRH